MCPKDFYRLEMDAKQRAMVQNVISQWAGIVNDVKRVRRIAPRLKPQF
jgi:hypothetical protein